MASIFALDPSFLVPLLFALLLTLSDGPAHVLAKHPKILPPHPVVITTPSGWPSTGGDRATPSLISSPVPPQTPPPPKHSRIPHPHHVPVVTTPTGWPSGGGRLPSRIPHPPPSYYIPESPLA
ncbi:hypothetical protein RND81_08G193000 [Saponaria officinalis]|uniref:Uncharacterized protein n=1 Tax=Saponaria officinalis TaxID=3572 RepID=A0AAW1JAY6_SAPOF